MIYYYLVSLIMYYIISVYIYAIMIDL